MTGRAAARNTRTNGPSAPRVTAGQNGVTNGMRTSIQMVMVSNKGRHGGKENMESAGTALGVRVTKDLDGCISMERAAVASTGILMWSKIRGTRGIPILGSNIASRIQSSYVKFGNHLSTHET